MEVGPERLAVVIAAASLGLTLGCVGSEPRQERQEASGAERAATAATRAGRDTVAPAPYRIFDSEVVSERPRRVMYHVLVMGESRPEALGKAMRVALDSIGGADSTLAAARAILYQVERVEARRGKLVPAVWGEWVPAEGWDKVGARSARQIYRTYVYHGYPGWQGTPPAAVEEAETGDGQDD